MRRYFITGTDTDVGKTYITVKLLQYFNQKGYQTLGVKPLASGCFYQNNILYNDDALLLQAASSIQLKYDDINPLRFQPPIAPNIAAMRENKRISVEELNQKISTVLNYPSDILMVEGVGGFCVPLNESETMADFVRFNHFNVILVVNMKLGCLNHGILTYQAIQRTGVSFAGWIANHISSENQSESAEMIITLEQFFKSPCLGKAYYREDITNLHL